MIKLAAAVWAVIVLSVNLCCPGPWSLSDDQMQELWEEHSEFATLALQSLSQGDDNDNNAIPFDAASELPEDVQR